MAMALQQPQRLTQNQFSLIIFIIMSPCRKTANYRPAEPLLTLFANTLVMNKARLQTQTGVGCLVILTMNIRRRESAWVTVDLLQISTICFISTFTYEWLKTQKGRLEVGEGMNIDDSSVCWVWGRGGRDWMVPAIQMSVICSASEGGETMLVTVGDRDSWLSH